MVNAAASAPGPGQRASTRSARKAQVSAAQAQAMGSRSKASNAFVGAQW